MPFAQNLITNPSFELDLAGYTALLGTTITQDFEQSLYGDSSMRVDTDGTDSTQGFYSPSSHQFHTNPYSGSLHILGTGVGATVFVELVQNPGGVVLVSVPVLLSDSWQRITLDGATVPESETFLFLRVRTTSPLVLSFWIDGVEIEQNSASTKYTDGDQYGCVWDGTPHASTSTREVEFAIISEGFSDTDGTIEIIIPGLIVQTGAAGFSETDGTVAMSQVDVVGVFDDFAIYGLTDNDPARTYVRYTNAGVMTGGYQKDWERVYALFTPPLDYPTSEGLLWKRAAYAAVGFKFTNVPANKWEYLDDVQLEMFHITDENGSYSSAVRYDYGDEVVVNLHRYTNILPTINNAPSGGPSSNTWWRYIGDTFGPTEYTTPRQTHTLVKPTRLNYVENPSFETSLNFWVDDGDVTLSRDNVGVEAAEGDWSLKVAIESDTDPNPGAYIDVDQLIVGRVYTASAFIQGSEDLGDVLMSCGSGSVTLSGAGTPYGYGEYGDGPYGGLYPPGDVNNFPEGVWLRMSFQFTATNFTQRLRFIGTPIGSPSYPVPFWIDGVMIEEGEIVHDYFDGGFGFDYVWETGGVANESRSYYYEGRRVKTYITEQIVAENVPLGITAAAPVIAEPPTQ